MSQPKGKARKTLPPIADDISLTKFGYKVKRSVSSRKQSLRKASKKYGSLKVLRHLNLIRNYTKPKGNKKVLSEDVDYMKKYHTRSKKKSSKKMSKKKPSKKK